MLLVHMLIIAWIGDEYGSLCTMFQHYMAWTVVHSYSNEGRKETRWAENLIDIWADLGNNCQVVRFARKGVMLTWDIWATGNFICFFSEKIACGSCEKWCFKPSFRNCNMLTFVITIIQCDRQILTTFPKSSKGKEKLLTCTDIWFSSQTDYFYQNITINAEVPLLLILSALVFTSATSTYHMINAVC